MAQQITALPTPPSRQSPGTFSDRADAFLGALPGFVTEANALAEEAETNAAAAESAVDDAAVQVGLATTQAGNAAGSAQAAAASASAAAAASNADKWVSDTYYNEGISVWSPSNYRPYRRKSAGAGTIDPRYDRDNWAAMIDESLLATLAMTSSTPTVVGGQIAALNYATGNKALYTYTTGNLTKVEYTDTDGVTIIHTATITYTDGVPSVDWS